MFLTYLAAMAAASSDFQISDTTDNITGVRTVSALQLQQEGKDLNFLYLRCDEHKPAFVLKLYDFNPADWVVVTLSGGDGPDIPFVFEQVAGEREELRLSGDVKTLISELREDEVREFIAHSPLGNRRMSFGLSGFTAAWKRVTAACH